MHKLYFKYGAMDSGKTAQALMTKYNYEEKGTRVWLIKPATDVRDGTAVLRSRIGLEAAAFIIPQDMNIKSMFEVQQVDGAGYEVIIADESQFFGAEQILQLRQIVSEYDIPVICFGLRTDFSCTLFPGSRALFELADDIAEIKSVCACGARAIVNARFDENGRVTAEGPQVVLGGSERYAGMCWTCWKKALSEDNNQ